MDHAVLTARHDVGAGLQLVTLTPPPDVSARYRAPGQYIKVLAGGGGYFVLAGDVGSPSWELLVRTNGGASDVLTTAAEGTRLELTGPFGTGFPLARAHGRMLVVAIAGSALAAARPILRERIARDEQASTVVYLGVRTTQEIALLPEVAGWAHAGARLVLCLSRAAEDAPDLLLGAERASGWVQHVIERDLEAGRLEGALVFAAGPAGMLDALVALGGKAGESGASARTLEVVPNA